MKLTVIGFWGAYPGKESASSGYLVQASGYNILLDCGSGVLSKLYKYIDINDLDSVVLSHYHPDHIADVGVVQHGVIVQKAVGKRIKPLTFYGHTEDSYFEKLALKDYTQSIGYEEKKKYTIGPLTFSFLRVEHPVPAFSMRIDNGGYAMGYTGDTGWNTGLIDFFQNVDFLLCESSLFTEFKGRVPGHLTAQEAGILAKRANVGRLVLTHLPHWGDHSDLKREAAAEYDGPVDLAEEGKSWEI